jgi:hypothetical protein
MRGDLLLKYWEKQLDRYWYCSCVQLVHGGQPVPRQCSPFEMNRMRLLWLIISLLLPGCAGLNTEEPVQVEDLSEKQSEDEAEKNLAAIRALLSKPRERAPLASDSSGTRGLDPESPSWPVDWLSSYFSPKPSPGQESDPASVYMAPTTSLLSRRRAAPPDFTVKIPRATEPSARSSDAEPWPRVPAYTVPPSPGSAYPGTTRCVPDLLGGQRCHAD